MSAFKVLVTYSSDSIGNRTKNNGILLWIQIPNVKKELEQEEKNVKEEDLSPTYQELLPLSLCAEFKLHPKNASLTSLWFL